MWRRGLDDLAEGAEPGIEEVVADRREPVQRQTGIAVDTILGQCIVPEQPRPRRTLMVGAVAMPRVAAVMRLVVAMIG